MRGLLSGLLALCLFGAACAGEAIVAAVEDHPDALTLDGGDNLFFLTVVEAPSTVPISELKISAAAPGQTQTVLAYVHDDKDGDGAFSPGDRFTCSEPPQNLFGEPSRGSEVRVLILRDPGGSTLKELAEVRWTPPLDGG